MEDAHICLPSLRADGYWGSTGLFGVMDGHGGEQVARFCERHLPEELCKFRLERGSAARDFEAALVGAFHRMDELLQDRSASGPELQRLTNKPAPEAAGRAVRPTGPVDADLVGCTACVCCVTEDQLVVANAGDSRAVLCRGGRAVALSEDHKPNDAREKRRIEAAGGYVENSGPGQYRVNGNLNLSRALGDLEYKKDATRGPEEQIICATPDVEFAERSEEDEFLVICCDGVWDVKTNQEVVDFIRNGFRAAPPDDPQNMVRVLEALLDSCVSPDLRLTRGLGGDNMTAVLVRFPSGRPPSAASDSSARRSCPPEQRAAAPASDGSRRSPDAAPDDGRPRLLRARLETAPAEPAGGALVVHVGLPAGCALRDVSLRVSEPTGKLEVSVADKGPGGAGGVVESFGLQEHLPQGAELSLPRDVGALAKFFAKTEVLRISLPWRRPV